MPLSAPPELFELLAEHFPSGVVPLTELGKLWRRADPSFSPNKYGATTLSSLLRRYPEDGLLEGSGVSAAWRFKPSADAEPTKPDVQASPQKGVTPKEGREARRLRQDVWVAVTQGAGSKMLDLDTLELFDATSREVSEQPERFLALPDMSPPRQVALLREFIAGKPLLNGSSTDEDPRRVIESISNAGLSDEWRHFRTQGILAMVSDWMREHEIPEHKFFQVQPVPRTRVPAPTKSGGDAKHLSAVPQAIDESKLRAWLHDAIDQMTAAELLDVRVPLRLFYNRVIR